MTPPNDMAHANRSGGLQLLPSRFAHLCLRTLGSGSCRFTCNFNAHNGAVFKAGQTARNYNLGSRAVLQFLR